MHKTSILIKEHKSPKNVLMGVILLFITNIVSLFGAFMGYYSTLGNIKTALILSSIYLLPFTIIMLFCTYKVFKGKRWARNLYFIYTITGIFTYLMKIGFNLNTIPVTFIISTVEVGISVISMIYLFSKPASMWFNSNYKKEKKKKINKDYIKKILVFTSLLLLVIGVIHLVSLINNETLLEKIGIGNGYLIAFFLSLLAGFSAVTSVIAFTFIGTLVACGLNPLLLGIIGGISFSLGDMLMFKLGSKGRELVTGRIDKEITYLSDIIKNRKLEKFIPFLGYIYVALTPLPNDWLILFLATIEYPSKQTYKIIILGDFTLLLVYTLIVAQGISIFG